MVPYLGDFSEDETVYMPFNTFDSNDPSASVTITNLADADIKVHKDGNTSEIVTDGATVAIDFDGITGNHLFTIDTSVHADYATGSDYLVRMEGTTVDGATVNAWVGHFSIENRHSAGALRPATAGRTLVVDAAGLADANMVKSGPTGSGTAQTANDNGADINAILTDTAEIGAAGAGLTAINLPNQTMDIVGDITGNLSGSVGSVTGAVGSVTGNVGGDVQGNVDGTVATVTTNTDMRGTDSAALASVCTEGRLAELDAANLPTDVAAIPTTAMRGTDSAALASVCTEARLAELDAANLPADIAALNDISVADVLTTQMTESYAANGVAPTLAQSQFAMHQMLMQFGISGTSLTVRKLDDSTTAFVVTLDDATNPTDAKRV